MKDVTIYWDETNPSIKNQFINETIVNANYNYTTNYSGNIQIEVLGLNNEFIVSPDIFGSISIDFTEIIKLINLGTINFTLNCFTLDSGGNAGVNGINNTNVENYTSLYDNCFTSISQFPNSIVSLLLGGDLDTTPGISDLSGEIDYINNFQNLNNIKIYGTNNLTGDIGNFIENQNLNFFNIGGNNTISGDISNFKTHFPNLIVLKLMGINSISGDILELSESLNEIDISGNNALVGNKFPIFTKLKSLSIGGQYSSFDVNLDFFPTSNYIYLETKGDLYGEFSNLIKSPNTYIFVDNISTVTYTPGVDWSSYILQTITISSNNGFIESKVLDDFFIDLDATCTQFAYPYEISIQGEVTTLSETARDNLTNVYGVEINIYT